MTKRMASTALGVALMACCRFGGNNNWLSAYKATARMRPAANLLFAFH